MPKNDISITLSGCGADTEDRIRKFIAPRPLFLGIDQSSSIEEQQSVTLKYKSYINDVRELRHLIGGGFVYIHVKTVGMGAVTVV